MDAHKNDRDACQSSCDNDPKVSKNETGIWKCNDALVTVFNLGDTGADSIC